MVTSPKSHCKYTRILRPKARIAKRIVIRRRLNKLYRKVYNRQSR